MTGLKEKLEIERRKLHELIEKCATKEEIQRQSEELDKYIVNYYSTTKGV